jgi:hypothetical protein
MHMIFMVCFGDDIYNTCIEELRLQGEQND